jgi:hypothetical protein
MSPMPNREGREVGCRKIPAALFMNALIPELISENVE